MPVRTTNTISLMGDFCMSVLKNRISAVVAGSAVIVALGATGAVAGNLIGSADIRDGGVHRVDLGNGVNSRIDNKATAGQVNGIQNRVTDLEGESDSGSDLIVGAGYNSTWAAHSYGETIETCPEGQYAIGGGYSAFGGYQTHPGYDLGGENRNIEVTGPS